MEPNDNTPLQPPSDLPPTHSQTPMGTQVTERSNGSLLPQGQTEDEALKYILPVNRTPLSVIAGYVALFSILLIPAPIAFLLGILALRQLKRQPNRLGKGRAWFAIIAGGLFSIPLALLIISHLSN